MCKNVNIISKYIKEMKIPPGGAWRGALAGADTGAVASAISNTTKLNTKDMRSRVVTENFFIFLFFFF